MKEQIKLSVRERVDAALKLARRENQRAKLTVSELSRLAGVSRANLYASHPDIVLGLRSESRTTRAHRYDAETSKKLAAARLQLAQEVRKNRALIYLVIELRAELQRSQNRAFEGKETMKAVRRRSTG